MNSKYDVFISYRRDGGCLFARSICYYLRNMGVSCFVDFKEIKGGRFDKQIEESMNQSTYILILLTKNSLNRCVDKDDWVRKEIECALSKKDQNSKIIPVMSRGKEEFEFPAELPESLACLQKIHAERIDEEEHFERDVRDLLANRMEDVWERYRKKIRKEEKRHQEEAEAAFCEQARYFKEEDHVRIDFGQYKDELLRTAKQLGIDESRAVVLIRKVDRSVVRARDRKAWFRNHSTLVMFIIILLLGLSSLCVYKNLPLGIQGQIKKQYLIPTKEACVAFWNRVCSIASKDITK